MRLLLELELEGFAVRTSGQKLHENNHISVRSFGYLGIRRGVSPFCENK